MIVPSGIATDDTTKVFFADLVDRPLSSLAYMTSRTVRKYSQVSYIARIKFCLLTLSRD